MTTDQDGFNTYIHVLIFYEEVNEGEIRNNDFDMTLEQLKKKRASKVNHQSKRTKPSIAQEKTEEFDKAASPEDESKLDAGLG